MVSVVYGLKESANPTALAVNNLVFERLFENSGAGNLNM